LHALAPSTPRQVARGYLAAAGGREQPSAAGARAAAVLRDGPDTFAGPCSTRNSTVRVVMPRAAAIRWLDIPVTQEFREALSVA
jgi:allophanate hydrolase subunit 2